MLLHIPLLLLDTAGRCEIDSAPATVQVAAKSHWRKEWLCPEGSCFHFAFGAPANVTTSFTLEVGFEMHFEPMGGTHREIVPYRRHPLRTWPAAVCGSCVAHERGKVVLHFDNEFSWLASKVLTIACEVTAAPPDLLRGGGSEQVKATALASGGDDVC